MRLFRSSGVALLISLMSSWPALADPIALTFQQGYTTVGSIGDIPINGTHDLTYSPRGGSVEFIAGSLGTMPSGVDDAWSPPSYPISGTFSFQVGVLAPGSTSTYEGPWLIVSGDVAGSITGAYGMPGRWSGAYGGTATAVNVYDAASPQAIAGLPAPLLDILNHPDHFRIDVMVDGGDANYLDATLTFAPPATTQVPEPTALATLVVAAAGLSLRRRLGAVRRA